MTLPPGCTDVRPVAGGDINEAYRVRLAGGREAFVKTRAAPAPGEYAAEAAALAWLAQARALCTPDVLAVDDAYLALAWVSPGRLGDAGEERLGRGLALLHAAGAPCFGDPGGLGPARLGSLLLANDTAADWATFYAERRLLPLMAAARARGALSPRGAAKVERVCACLSRLVGDAEPPARLHGDLWSGNVMADARGEPWLIDPCAYGGHREVDLAMLRLFGGSSRRTFAAYAEAHPLAAG